MAPRVLVVEGDPGRSGLVRLCRSLGLETLGAEPASLRSGAPAADVVLLDLDAGPDLLARFAAPAGPPVVALAAEVDVDRAVEALRAGARDLLAKPVDPEALQRSLARVLPPSAPAPRPAHGLLGDSEALRAVLETVARVARAPRSTVLVLGESGTGKELVSRAIHDASTPAEAPFVAVNCAALTDTLLEAELFGYEPGAFTGADPKGRAGLLAAAAGGTIFLDEVAELAPALQAKLLRVLQERTYRRVGGVADQPLEARVVASTHRDLVAMVAAGEFREDLFYRLNVLTVRLPALRERPEDVSTLAEHFLAVVGSEVTDAPTTFAPEVLEDLARRRWPGNVRELRNTVERLALRAEGTRIEVQDLEPEPSERPAAAGGGEVLPLRDRSLRGMEEALIRQVLDESEGNRSRAARVLGVNRQTLYNKLRAYGIQRAAS